MNETITQKWVNFLSTVRFREMPPDVIHQTKMYILDHIGCALGGYTLDWGKKVCAVGRDLGGRGEATVAGSGDKLHCANAAYVNNKLANILDMDEVLYNTRHIGGVPVFPALSVGERIKATGKEVILATALAYDFAARCGLCGCTFRPDPERGVVVSEYGGLGFNSFTAAIAASKIFKLDKGQWISALSCAGHFAPGPIESKFAFTPPANFNKYGDMGWFCLAGIIASLCAKNGYVGDPSILDGTRGLMRLLGATEFDFDTFIADLGKRWYILDAGIKPYPTCRWMGTGIKLLEDIMKKHGLKPNDINRIIINTHFLGKILPTYIAADNWAESEGRELWLSQFSFTYALACTVHGITPGPNWAKKKTLTDPKIVEMTKKISHGEHPNAKIQAANWKGHPGKIFSQPPTSIEVKSNKGTFSDESCDIPGDSWNPKTKLTDDEMIMKFTNNASQVLKREKIEEIIDVIEKLDKVENLAKLTKLLAR